MSVRRINPETGVIEERGEFVDAVSDGAWKSLVNEHGTNNGLTLTQALPKNVVVCWTS